MGTLTSLLSLTSEGEEALGHCSAGVGIDQRKQVKNPLPTQV